jgi:hypothetical protein
MFGWLVGVGRQLAGGRAGCLVGYFGTAAGMAG